VSDRSQTSLSNVLLTLASLVVLIAGLQAAGQVLLPVLFAAFLAILCQPLVKVLMGWRVPRVLAVLLVVILLTGALLGLTALLGDSVRRFTESIPQYQGRLDALVTSTEATLTAWGLPPPPVDADVSLIDPGALLTALGQTLSAVLTVLSRLVIVVLTAAFILLEAAELDHKVRVVFGADSDITRSLLEGSRTVQRYLAIKTVASLCTGAIVGALNASLGLDFALLWGVVAFLFNYVPSIGSIVAALPAVLLALVQLGPVPALVIAVGYTVTNVAIGNVIEPRVLGRRLGLSPLVVILSLFFWGFVWGPTGMLLSVPMTVVLKLLLEVSPGGNQIAVMLGPAQDAETASRRAITSQEPAQTG